MDRKKITPDKSKTDKRKTTSDKNTTTPKKRRLVITLEEKFDVIERHGRGDSNTKIGRDVGMPESTVRNIIKHAEQIKAKAKVASAFCGLQTCTRNRSVTMLEMERLLTIWIEDCIQNRYPLSRPVIQLKALELFKSVKEKNEVEETFTASVGWFDRFKNRVYMNNIKINAEVSNMKHANEIQSKDDDMGSKYPDIKKELIDDNEVTEADEDTASKYPFVIKKELTDDDPHLDQQSSFEESDNDVKEQDNVQVKEFTLEEFEDIFQAIEVVKQKIMDADPNLDRSMQICRDMDKALCVYSHMYKDLKKEKTVQSMLLKYLKRQ